MNASKILAAAALSLLAAAGAQAETYEGVLSVNSGVSRSEVAPQAVAAARAGNQYSEGASAGPQPFTSTVDRSVVQAGGRSRFTAEPLDGLDVLRIGLRKYFECDEPAKTRVLRLVDDAHAALAQLIDNLVLAECLPNRQRHRCLPGEGHPNRFSVD